MLRAIAVAAGCLMLLTAPVRAEDFSYTCNAKANKTTINFTADFSLKHGGKVTALNGSIDDDRFKETLKPSQVTQTWTSDQQFNIQFGTPARISGSSSSRRTVEAQTATASSSLSSTRTRRARRQSSARLSNRWSTPRAQHGNPHRRAPLE